MSTPIDFNSGSGEGGGNYGTSSSKSASARRRAAPGSDQSGGSSTAKRSLNQQQTSGNHNTTYGPFSSPHGSFDDQYSTFASSGASAVGVVGAGLDHPSTSSSTPFPPYSELPFTAMKRRRQLEKNNSFVKWAMRGVLMSPVVVLVMWSFVALVFSNNNHAHTNSRQNQQSQSQSQPRKNNRAMMSMSNMRRNIMSPFTMSTPQQQQAMQLQGMEQQQQAAAAMMAASGSGMMATPQQQQQQMMMMPQQLQQQQQPASVLHQQQQLQMAGDVSMNANAMRAAQQPQQYAMATGYQQQQQHNHIPVVGPLGSTGATATVIQQQQLQQMAQLDPSSLQQAQQYQETATSGSASSTDLSNAVHANALQQQDSSSASGVSDVQAQNTLQLQEPQKQQLSSEASSPAKQAVYYYDAKQTVTAQDGQVLQLPSVVYDQHGKAIPLAELRQSSMSTPIYVQPPAMGSAQQSQPSAMGTSSTSTDNNADPNVLLESATGALQMEAPPARGATQSPANVSTFSRLRPKAWGSSTSQDQSIIVATVAVMALLVGALSARRLRSKSFLASCIENETLEDDLAYDSAYTTTGG
eukprot:CAMPEP_0113495348 /NCGR_PEP_ID=MMETSP0014_2-20120614/29566_1 /TAXON_ID=2857 /ORGANISM="Nitzschia sp." /LENGTH=580 /DNA_ID=CAMNT_0000389249 /DNA_START=261 /DNA_END=2000 /DNA_ORIENTATION=+ /assembly_acc=CAM_ASM_000159